MLGRYVTTQETSWKTEALENYPRQNAQCGREKCSKADTQNSTNILPERERAHLGTRLIVYKMKTCVVSLFIDKYLQTRDTTSIVTNIFQLFTYSVIKWKSAHIIYSTHIALSNIKHFILLWIHWLPYFKWIVVLFPKIFVYFELGLIDYCGLFIFDDSSQ